MQNCKEKYLFPLSSVTFQGARGSAVDSGTMLQAGSSRDHVAMRCFFFFN
jgi:hypothetical protein